MAHASDGSLRDAEMLLDQLGTLSGGEIREDDVLFSLGLAGEEVSFELLEALRRKDAQKILSLVKQLYESGKDLAQFGRGLYELFRNLLLLRMGPGTEVFIEMSQESEKRLLSFKETFSREELLLILSLFQNLQGDLRRSLASPKLLLEIALLKLLHLEGLHQVKELLEGSEGVKSDLTPPVASASRPPRPPAGEAGNDEITSLSLAAVQRIWPQVLEAIKTREMSTGMFLAEAEPIEATGNLVVLGLPEEFQFHREMLERTEKRRLIEGVFSQFLGAAPQIQFVTTRLVEGENPRAAPPEKEAPKLPEIVRQAMDIFQGSKIIRADE